MRGDLLFGDFEAVQLVADGLQVALLGQPGQEGLHAAVELEFTIKLGRESGKESGKEWGVMLRWVDGPFPTLFCDGFWNRRSIRADCTGGPLIYEVKSLLI